MPIRTTAIVRLTRDPEIRATQSGTQVCALGIVSNDGTKDKPVATFMKAKAFGKVAEIIGARLKKGDQVELTGKIVAENWKTKEGEERTDLVINVSDFSFIGGKRDASESPAQAPTKAAAPAASAPAPAPEDDDVPF